MNTAYAHRSNQSTSRNRPHARRVWLVCALILIATTALPTTVMPDSPAAQAATDDEGLQLSIFPTVIPEDGTFVVTVKHPDGSDYNGLLDHDTLACPKDMRDRTQCRVSSGAWEPHVVEDGQVTVDIDNADGNGSRIDDGLYIARYRPRDSDSRYSNQVAYVVDRSARIFSEETNNNSGQYSVPQPVVGAYTIFEDRAPDGELHGYTKIEFEQDTCAENGVVQRFTKTASTAYWAPSGNPNNPVIFTLRWCIGPSPTNSDNFKAFGGGLSSFDPDTKDRTSLRYTRYFEPARGNLSRIGELFDPQSPAPAAVATPEGIPPRLRLLPAMPDAGSTGSALAQTHDETTPDSSALYYTLAPVNLFPEQLTSRFIPVIDRIIHYDPDERVLDTWHVEVRASQRGGLYEIRYVEWALHIANLSASSTFADTPSTSVENWNVFYRWNVLEDWDWNADGTLNRITQQGNPRATTTPDPDDLPIDCWTHENGCDSLVHHELTPVASYVPDHAPLKISFVDQFGSDVPVLMARANHPMRLRVQTADGEPYDGFLQIYAADDDHRVWTDADGYSIYVHNGYVDVLPEAFGAQPRGLVAFKVRQQLLTEAIAADKLLSSPSQPTNADQPFSNEIYFIQAFL